MKKIIIKQFSTINQADRQKFNNIQDWWSIGGSMAPLYSYNYLRVKYIHQMLNIDQKRQSLFNQQILDVGVGGGILSESLRRLGATVTGIDVSEQSIKTALQHKQQDPQLRNDDNLKYILTGPESLEGQFDIITAMEVIEHVADLNLFIKSLKQLLSPTGTLFISTISRNYESYLKLIIGAEYIANIVPKGTHDWNQFKNPEEMWLLLNRNKLRIVNQQGVDYNICSGEMQYSQNLTQYLMTVKHEN